MSSTRCAACKYLRRRCPSTCVLSPYFPPTDPQRFACVHKIYGASNVVKILQQVPVQQRAEAAQTLHYEAYCRSKDPVYGCVGIITELHEQIHSAQSELAKIQAKIAVIVSSQKMQTDQSKYDDEQIRIPPASSTSYAATSFLEGNAADPFVEFDPNSFPKLY